MSKKHALPNVVSYDAKYKTVHIQSEKKKTEKKEKKKEEKLSHLVRMKKAVIQVDKMLYKILRMKIINGNIFLSRSSMLV